MSQVSISPDWANLMHSHGPADDVPPRLAALKSPSSHDRSEALSYLWECLLHQGTRYEASPFVVPFLFEILEDAECRIQREVIDLLLALAVGYGESFLPFGYDLVREEQRYAQNAWSSLYGYSDARIAYYEVHKKARVFLRFLDPNGDPQTRLSAGFAVAHFAQPLSASHADVARYIEIEADEEQMLGLVLCYGMLARYTDVQPELSLLTEDFASSQSLRVARSIAITTILGPRTPESALQTLLTALTESWSLSSPREGWQWWNGGDLLGYAALALRLVGTDHRELVANALCAALTKTDACTFAIPETLLEILFPEPKPHLGWKVSAFDRIQRESLNVLLRTKHWRDWMISSRFLTPGLTGDAYRAAMKQFFNEIAEGNYGSEFMKLGDAGNVSSWDLKKHWP